MSQSSVINAGDNVLPGVKNVVLVASGKGGVGKSTTAVNLALALAKDGAQVGLLDADIYGPSQGLMLGVPEGQRPRVEDQKYFVPIKALGIKSMSMSYLVDENTPMVWRGPMATGALRQILTQTRWGELDYLIVDMPPGTGDIQLTMSQTVSVAGAVIVTTPQDIALLDARKAIEMFSKVSIPVLGILENMSVHICRECGAQSHIFGSEGGVNVARQYNTELLAALPLSIEIREQVDAGKPSVAADPESEISLIYREAGRKMVEAIDNLSGEPKPRFSVHDD
ncbi:MAG: iron-sulfur cluster carrier protein ApbC [Pseudomonadales bacterium]|nr:iron-sulfur cluster carrier protein ApbC [Pseudomonadales bacterium]